MVALQVGEDRVKDLADESLRRCEAHTITLLLGNPLGSITSLLFVVLPVDQDDLTKDLLEEEFEEVGDSAGESGIL